MRYEGLSRNRDVEAGGDENTEYKDLADSLPTRRPPAFSAFMAVLHQ